MTQTPSLTAAVVLSGTFAVGCLLMALAHTGITIPLLSSLGPGGGDAVPPAVVAFTVGLALFAAIAVGLWRRHRWAWLAGLVVSALVILSSVNQYRGVVSGVGIALALGLIALLLAPGTRSAVGREAR